MEGGETSWVTHHYIETLQNHNTFSQNPMSGGEEEEEEQTNSSLSMDTILPDDLLERIFAYLPIASIFRAGSVCKRWHEIIASKRFLWNSQTLTLTSHQKPWYFMFTSSDEPVGHAYDPILRKWHGIDLPRIETSSWIIASSYGLVCFMDNESRSHLYVCNPITKSWKELGDNGPPGPKFPDYSALALTVDRGSHEYSVAIVKSKQVPGDYFQWDLSIHLFGSETARWATKLTETLTGWRAGDESVICGGVLYFLMYSAGGGPPYNRHGLVRYELRSGGKNGFSGGLLMRSFIAVPYSLTCGRLMNLKERLVMVGGIGKQDRPDIIKGIGVWVLKEGREWQEIARMPHKFFQGFGELDDVFASSGTSDLIYIQSYGAPALLVFDVGQKVWRWSQKCPVAKRFPLQLFSGFCFEPRLEIEP